VVEEDVEDVVLVLLEEGRAGPSEASRCRKDACGGRAKRAEWRLVKLSVTTCVWVDGGEVWVSCVGGVGAGTAGGVGGFARGLCACA
jgi:hypothetical protein